MLRLFCFCLFLLSFSSVTHANNTDDIELLNATLVARLHLARVAVDGQMVGAYQVSFRALTAEPVTEVRILLNPGLDILKVVGAGNKPLRVSENVVSVKGLAGLTLNAATITLPEAIKKNKRRAEIVIHYKGYLRDLSARGLDGVRETLHPDFTMIRAEGFAYPVFAAPDMVSIERAWSHSPFHQVAFLDVPGNNTVVGNLSIAQKTTSGAITKFELKNRRPTGPMALAIAPYRTATEGPVTTAVLPQTGAGDAALNEPVREAKIALEDLFGTPASDAHLTVATLPEGYRTPVGAGAYFTAADTPVETSELKVALFDMWRMSAGRQGHWATGFDTLLEAIARGDQAVGNLQARLFSQCKSLMSDNSALGKTALVDYVIEGYSEQGDTISALAFAVLYGLMGREDFSTLAAKMRRELGAGYTDMATAADFLNRSIENKAARKFAKNWFSGTRAGKDMNRAASFEDLLSRYR